MTAVAAAAAGAGAAAWSLEVRGASRAWRSFLRPSSANMHMSLRRTSGHSVRRDSSSANVKIATHAPPPPSTPPSTASAALPVPVSSAEEDGVGVATAAAAASSDIGTLTAAVRVPPSKQLISPRIAPGRSVMRRAPAAPAPAPAAGTGSSTSSVPASRIATNEALSPASITLSPPRKRSTVSSCDSNCRSTTPHSANMPRDGDDREKDGEEAE